ncbi:MAG: FixH family protein [Thiohalomonadales bacterium]
MTVSLISGVLIIITIFFILKRITRIPANTIGAIVAVVVLIVFMPLAVIYWPGGDVFAIHLAIYMITVYGLAIIASHREKNSGVHWAPVVIIIFFVLLVLVDTFFVTIADKGLSSQVADMVLPKSDDDSKATYNYPGKVVHDYYQKGKLYNNYLENIEARKQSKWKIKKGWLTLPVVNEDAIFQVQLKDKDNNSITNATITGKFIRYSDSRLDVEFSMNHTQQGIYQVNLRLTQPGRWGLALKINYAAIVYELGGTTIVGFPKNKNQDKIINK